MSRQTLITLIVLAIFLASSISLALIPSDTLLAYIGSENAYLLMFALGLVGGFTTFSGIPYHVILMSLSAGGAWPLLLGVVTALGVMIGDSVMYGVSKRASHLVRGRVATILQSVAVALSAHPKLLAPALVLYGTISPFSNDFIVASLSFMGYSYRRIIIPLTIGNMFYNITLAYLGYYYYDVVVAWLG
jgi:uncharacterized membrane protein YdjX (TVP38/TMEM64 family)